MATERSHALCHVRVLDLSGSRIGGQAATVLADFGAEVLSVAAPEQSASTPFWRRGRPSAVLDHQTITKLASTADVVLVADRPSVVHDRGLDAGTLRAEHPALIHTSITAAGPAGPDAELPVLEGIVAARAGRMSAFDVQLNQGRPVYAALQVATHLASQAAVHGIVAALIQRERTGRGDRVETSLLQGLVPFDLVDLLGWQVAQRTGDEFVGLRTIHAMPTLNYHPLRTSDGKWIQCGNLLEHLFMSFLDATELLGEFLIEERFAGSPGEWTPETIEEARDRILVRMQEKTADEWMAIFDGNGNVAAEPILTSAQAIDHRDIANRLVMIEDPVVGPTVQIGAIAEFSATPGLPQPRTLVGPDDVAGWNPRPEEPVFGDHATVTGRPLAGVTILDLSTIIAGPLGISMLADLGARVIKVEPATGDPFRLLIPDGRIAVKMNQGKESICVDLKQPEGRAVMHRLAAQANAVVHNFRGEVPAKLGVDHATLEKVRPGIVSVTVSGYSAASPSATRPATHPVIGAATGGVAWQAGDAITRDCPTLADVRETSRAIMAANEANPDPNTSVVVASATLLALFHQQRTGEGQSVRVDMQAANAWANGDDFLRYEDKPPRPNVDVDHLGLGPIQRLYQTTDGWVYVEARPATETNGLRALAEATGQSSPDLSDPNLATAIAQAIRGESTDHWTRLLGERGIACIRADDIEIGALWTSDPQVLANDWAAEVDHPRFGRFRRWAPLTTVGGGNPALATAPLAGEHTDSLLEELGYASDEIAELRRSGIVASEPINPI